MLEFFLKIFYICGFLILGGEFLKVVVLFFFEEFYCFIGLLVWSNFIEKLFVSFSVS